jgi:hypothetical protein
LNPDHLNTRGIMADYVKMWQKYSWLMLIFCWTSLHFNPWLMKPVLLIFFRMKYWKQLLWNMARINGLELHPFYIGNRPNSARHDGKITDNSILFIGNLGDICNCVFIIKELPMSLRYEVTFCYVWNKLLP